MLNPCASRLQRTVSYLAGDGTNMANSLRQPIFPCLNAAWSWRFSGPDYPLSGFDQGCANECRMRLVAYATAG